MDGGPRRNFGKYSRLLGPRQLFELSEAPVGMTSCQGSKFRQLSDHQFTALVGWLHCFKVVNLLNPPV